MKRISFLLIQFFVLAVLGQSIFAQHNYPEVLQKSLFFYEAQQAGKLPDWNRVSWRGDAAVNDGQDVGLDLTGGWFDAGDHVKFNFPMAYSVTTLCWGYLENKEAYNQYGQKQIFLNNIKFVTDYLIKCHTSKYEFYGQFGLGNPDHNFWGPAEMVEKMMDRPSLKIDKDHPGSDLAGEAAAALAAASMVFADEDPTYSATLLKHAGELYEFADTYRGKYHLSIKDAEKFYKSWSGYNDELVWGAIWLYKATKNEEYLTKAKEGYSQLGGYDWTCAWDNKSTGCYALMAQITGEKKYMDDIELTLEKVFPESNNGAPKLTPAGFPIYDQWGSNRYAASTAFLLLEHSDIVTDNAKKTAYRKRAKEIMDYILGDNPQKMSYVIGYGENFPKYAHHRSAHGSWQNNNAVPAETRHILYGALVGGHKKADDNNWVDNRVDYVWNEVACDYNSLFTGAAARLAADHGGSIVANFPEEETPKGEFFVEAKDNSSGDTYSQYAIAIWNRTSWPARFAPLSFKFFIDISEGLKAGFSPSDYTISGSTSDLDFSELTQWDGDIYYIEAKLKRDDIIYPGGHGESKKEFQIGIRLPYNASSSDWDTSNDWSGKDITGQLLPTENIALYSEGKLVYGNEPGPAVIVPADGITLTPSTATVCVGKTTSLDAKVTPANASDKKVTYKSSDETVATVSNNGVVTAVSAGTATITATSNDGSFTATSTITVEECATPVYHVSFIAPENGSFSVEPNKAEYEEGDVVTIEATADEGYVFANWKGDLSGNKNPETITITKDVEVGAEFLKKSEGGNSDCSTYQTQTIPLEIEGAETYCIKVKGDISNINSWGMDKVTLNGLDITNTYIGAKKLIVPADKVYKIEYVGSKSWSHLEVNGVNIDFDGGDDVEDEEIETPTQYTLTTNVIGEGSIQPVNGEYEEGTEVSLVATPSTGWEFDSWSGDANGTNSSITLVMNANKSVTAKFIETVIDDNGDDDVIDEEDDEEDDVVITGKNWLHVEGNKLYDSRNKEVQLTGINWFGFETSNLILHGLWSRDLESCLQQIKDLGFNCLRIPWCNAMLEPDATFDQVNVWGPDSYTGVNPMNEEVSKTNKPIEALDVLVKWCQENDMKVILDCHSREPGGYLGEKLWYTAKYTHEKWISDWEFMANRYKEYDAVIGMDLNNEPHGKNGDRDKSTWGSGDPKNDWRLAAQECGNAILKINPEVLIIVEGVEQYNGSTYWWGGNLQGAKDYPVELSNPSKLMYSPHEYGPTVFNQPWFSDAAFPSNLRSIWEEQFNFLYTEGISPLYFGEYGIKDLGGKDEIWFNELVDYLAEHKHHWTFWCWNPNSGDTGGLLDNSWKEVTQWKIDKISPNFAPEIPNGKVSTTKSSISSVNTKEVEATVVKVFPVPFDKQINVEISNPDEVTKIEIFNIRGQLIQVVKPVNISAVTTIDLAKKEAMYILRVHTTNNIVSKTLIRK